MKRILCSLFVIGVFTSAASAEAPLDLETGRQAYADNCARCHGVTGAGDGRDAARMNPKPRKLSEGVFKFRTTASGTPPTDQDLFTTISEGLPGSRLPKFQRLSEETRWQLVHYVKSLSPIFQDQKPEPIDLGKDPGPQKANLSHGKELYAQLGCNACHGALGRADGPSAPALADPWGDPIPPADLTQGWRYRSGSSPKEIMTRLMTGLDGTPMPSYAEATTPADAWDLAYYVHSLQVKPNWSRTVAAVRPAGTQTDWQKIPRADLRLTGSTYQNGALLSTRVAAVSVQVAREEDRVALRLSWHDPVRNSGPETSPDAAGLLFLPDRRSKLVFGSVRGWPASPELPGAELIYWSADRDAARMGSESLLTQASFADGEWSLVVTRPIPAGQKSLRFGVMVWDGGNQEQDRRRSNSSWVDLLLE